MNLLRHLASFHARALLAFAVAALGMQALVPAGLMVTPAQDHFASIILCPETNPLARAAAKREAKADGALHAAMGHGARADHAHDHHHAATPPIDHVAMGHGPASDDRDTPASAAGNSGACAFSGLALAGLLTERSDLPTALLAWLPEQFAPPQRLQLVAPAYLRPPLRGPPLLI
jgi:hypothetical protein